MNCNEVSQILAYETRDGDDYGATGILLMLGGSNLEISDCDLYSSASVFDLVDAKCAYIARNRFSVGRCGGDNFDGCDRVICEDNTFVGGDNMAQQGLTFWSSQPNRNIYCYRNTVAHFHRWDSEGIGTDGDDGQYFGLIRSAGGPLVRLPARTWLTQDKSVDHMCFVASGAGQGQWRRVVRNTRDTLRVDRAWDVLPKGGRSIVGVNHEVSHFLVVENEIRDAGIGFQFYGAAMDSIVAGNKCRRAGGFRSHAGLYQHNQPQFFIQYINNQILDGPTPWDHYGGDKDRDRTLKNSDILVDCSGPISLGIIIRDNEMQSHAGIRILAASGDAASPLIPPIQDVIVEGNKVSHTDVGLEVSGPVSGVLIRNNVFDDVDTCLTASATVLPQPWANPLAVTLLITNSGTEPVENVVITNVTADTVMQHSAVYCRCEPTGRVPASGPGSGRSPPQCWA
jgi:hypothetical protein